MYAGSCKNLHFLVHISTVELSSSISFYHCKFDRGKATAFKVRVELSALNHLLLDGLLLGKEKHAQIMLLNFIHKTTLSINNSYK